MRALLLSLALLLPSCALFAPAEIPVSQQLSVQAQAAQKSINEANVALASAANVIAQNVTDGIMTKPEAQAMLDKVKDYAKKVDAAQTLLNSGDILSAKNQADLIKSAILALHKEVAKRARQ